MASTFICKKCFTSETCEVCRGYNAMMAESAKRAELDGVFARPVRIERSYWAERAERASSAERAYEAERLKEAEEAERVALGLSAITHCEWCYGRDEPHSGVRPCMGGGMLPIDRYGVINRVQDRFCCVDCVNEWLADHNCNGPYDEKLEVYRCQECSDCYDLASEHICISSWHPEHGYSICVNRDDEDCPQHNLWRPETDADEAETYCSCDSEDDADAECDHCVQYRADKAMEAISCGTHEGCVDCGMEYSVGLAQDPTRCPSCVLSAQFQCTGRQSSVLSPLTEPPVVDWTRRRTSVTSAILAKKN